MTTFFEDLTIGTVRDFGAHEMTAEAIIEFGRKFDPQPFHVDPEAARSSPFGGLVASGWHTTAVCMRMAVEEFLGPSSGSLGSPGVDEIRWLAPVRPGDILSVRLEVLDQVPSRSKSDRGHVRFRFSVRNQHQVEVMTMIGLGIFRRRQPVGEEA